MNHSIRIRSRFSEDGVITLYNGDCRRLLDKIPDDAVQLVVTSPPYSIGKSYEKKQTFEQNLALQKEVIGQCVRVTRPGGSICWQVGNHVNGHGQLIPLDLLLYPIFAAYEKASKIRLRNRIIWHFGHGLHSRLRLSGRHEAILWFTKGDSYIFNLDSIRVPQKYPGKKAYRGPHKGMYSGNPLGKNPGDVWIFPNVKGNHIEKTVHPCQFPVELPERLVLALSRPGDLVLDPFLGVGSTMVAALLHGRRAAGSELKLKYFRIARQRVLTASRGVLRYRQMHTPIYQPVDGTPLTTPPPHFKALARLIA